MSKNSKMIRIWKQVDVEGIKNHLVLIDDHYGICAKCQQTGLKFTEDKKCKGCGTSFKYLATTRTNPAEVGKILSRIQKADLDLQVIDRLDYDRASAKNTAHSLFNQGLIF